jgi:hypothetical protein
MPKSHSLHINLLKQLKTLSASFPSQNMKIALFEEDDPEKHALELVAGIDSIDFVIHGAKCPELALYFSDAHVISM